MASTSSKEEFVDCSEHSHRFSPEARKVSGGTEAEGECRICLQQASSEFGGLIQPCSCSSAAHYSCLSQWVLEKRSLTCEVCKKPYHPPYYGRLQAHLEAHPRPEGARDTYGVDSSGQVVRLYVVPAGDSTTTSVRNNNLTWKDVLCHLAVLATLLALILYLMYFSSLAPSASSSWSSVLWRVLAILIPAYLLGRLGWAVWMSIRARRRAEALAAEAAQQQQQQRQQQHQAGGVVTQAATQGSGTAVQGVPATGADVTTGPQAMVQPAPLGSHLTLEVYHSNPLHVGGR